MAQLPQGSRLYRRINEASDWTFERAYLAYIVDGVNRISWQLSGGKQTKQPESVVPRSVIKSIKKSAHEAKGGQSLDIDKLKALLSQPRK